MTKNGIFFEAEETKRLLELKEKYIGKTFERLYIHDITKIKTDKYTEFIALVSCKCSPYNYYYTNLHTVLNGECKSCGCYKTDGLIEYSRDNKSRIANSIIGTIYDTNQGNKILITSYEGRSGVGYEFLNVKYPCSGISTMQNIKNGQVRYPYTENEYGGIYGDGKYSARENGKKTIYYQRWMGILFRISCSPLYRGVKIHDSWKFFQIFSEWLDNQYLLYNKYNLSIDNLVIDKDFGSLKLPNYMKIYSPETCNLIPMQLNNQIINIYDFSKQQLLEIVDEYKPQIPTEIYNNLINIIIENK